MNTMNKILRIENVNKTFTENGMEVQALVDINLEFEKGEFTVIIGPSGCGKSTFLYLLAGFEKPTGGQIYLDDNLIVGPGPNRGFIFQDYALFPWKTVLGNVMFGLLQNGWNKSDARDRAMELIQMAKLTGFENAFPHTLSGGMKQRVGIIRALAYDPEVLLMDEPFAALDAQSRKQMQQELIGIWEQSRKTVVFVTHSVVEAVYLADRIIVFTAHPGRVKKIIDVPIERPRSFVEDSYLHKRTEVLASLNEEIQKASLADADFLPA